jgi:tetraacyldisaccharide 4'-kinase
MPQGSADRRARRQARWQQAAQARGLASYLLWPVSLIYRLLVALRRSLYSTGWLPSQHLPVPVIVVGNVVVGGAGKTPTVIALVRHLQASGWHPGVISRGYGRTGDAVVHLTSAADPALSGDEPALIHQATGAPVCVARRRTDAAQALLAQHPQTDVLLCDDGLQHHALARDLSIAVFDERGVGNGWLLPAGLLREPWPPAPGSLNAPDLLLVHARQGFLPPHFPIPASIPRFDAIRRLATHVFNQHGDSRTLASLRSHPVDAVAGIARPSAFFGMLRDNEIQIQRELPMPDHAATADYRAVLRDAGSPLVCTEKDAVKLHPLAGTLDPAHASPPIWAVPLELAVEPRFYEAIDARLKAWKHRQTEASARS